MSKDTQHAALQGYLDALLTDAVPEPCPAAEPVAFLDVPEVAFSLPPMALREPLISEAQISQLPMSVSTLEEQDDSVVSPSGVVTTASEFTKSSWADSAFECLLFDVAGLTLAVPLVALGSIYTFEANELTPLFAQPDWFIGILPAQKTNLKVLETARWVMPERYTADMRHDLKYVISINGYDWGLAVHQVRHSIRLQPSDVKWRMQRGKRPWLAGTVIEHMCALLDVEVLAQLITGKNTSHNTA